MKKHVITLLNIKDTCSGDELLALIIEHIYIDLTNLLHIFLFSLKALFTLSVIKARSCQIIDTVKILVLCTYTRSNKGSKDYILYDVIY